MHLSDLQKLSKILEIVAFTSKNCIIVNTMNFVTSRTEAYKSNRRISDLTRRAAQYLAMRDTVQHPEDIRVVAIQREKIPGNSVDHEVVQRVGAGAIQRLGHTTFRFDADASMAVQEDRAELAKINPELAARVEADPEITPDDAIIIFRRDSQAEPHPVPATA